MSVPASSIESLSSTIAELSAKVKQLEGGARVLKNAHDDTLPGLWFSGSNGVFSPTLSAQPSFAGDTAWMLVSTALVLFMTMPGLALYYSGMVAPKNVLSTTMQIFSITCLITFLWLCFGYSLAFTPVRAGSFGGPFYGDASRFWLRGMTVNSYHMNAITIPESVYCTYQLTFAIITPALICGSFADRMKYWPMMLFMAIWHIIVYCPLAHANWHPDGFIAVFGAIDYAGGNVVHIASGMAGLMAALILGRRKGWTPGNEDSHPPHNILMTYMGMSMLWVGWFGFNAGSAVGASTRAGYAMLATQISTSVAALSWMLTETLFMKKKPSVLGMINGAVAGLVSITPASGFVDMNGAFWIGLAGGSLCFFGSKLKHWALHIDDSLDAFGVHAIGGIIGGLMTGLFATKEVTGGMTYLAGRPDYYKGNIQDGVFSARQDSNTMVGWYQLGKQFAGVFFAVGYSGGVSWIILKAIDLTIGLRVTEEEEEVGLDSSLHGEVIPIPVITNEEKSKPNTPDQNEIGITGGN